MFLICETDYIFQTDQELEEQERTTRELEVALKAKENPLKVWKILINLERFPQGLLHAISHNFAACRDPFGEPEDAPPHGALFRCPTRRSGG